LALSRKIASVVDKHGLSKSEKCLRARFLSRGGSSLGARILLKSSNKDLLSLACKPWSQVVSKTYIGKQDTYDIEVFGNNHSYVVNGVVCHNSAADIVMIAMRNFDRSVKRLSIKDRRWEGVKMLLQVHDEILVETPEEIADEVSAQLKRDMETATTLSVPLVADPKIGNSWLECK
jgi:hypothetical protein